MAGLVCAFLEPLGPRLHQLDARPNLLLTTPENRPTRRVFASDTRSRARANSTHPPKLQVVREYRAKRVKPVHPALHCGVRISIRGWPDRQDGTPRQTQQDARPDSLWQSMSSPCICCGHAISSYLSLALAVRAFVERSIHLRSLQSCSPGRVSATGNRRICVGKRAQRRWPVQRISAVHNFISRPTSRLLSLPFSSSTPASSTFSRLFHSMVWTRAVCYSFTVRSTMSAPFVATKRCVLYTRERSRHAFRH